MTRTDTASRFIAAEPVAVFVALTDPTAWEVWLPPAGMRAKMEHFDLRAGGTYRMTLTYDEPPASGGKSAPDSDVVTARFLDIAPGDRVVQAVDFDSDDPAFTGTMIMTWSVTPTEGGTLVEFRADDVPAGISAADHATGMESSLANLAAYLHRR